MAEDGQIGRKVLRARARARGLAVGECGRLRDVANRLRLFGKAVSWGGAESLVITGHKSDPMGKGGEGPRIPAGLLRLSIGFEGAHALIEDLDQALAL